MSRRRDCHAFAPGTIVHCRPVPKLPRRVWLVAVVMVVAVVAAAVAIAVGVAA